MAILDWQLQDLKKADAAVDVQKKARPVRHDPAIDEISPPPRKGIERSAPIVVVEVVVVGM